MKEKLAHLDKAKAAMENGTGSFHSYAKENGISRSTFYKWAHTHGYSEDSEQYKPSTPFVKLGKQPEQQESESRKLVLSGFGARIEIILPGSLLALLQGIRIESST
ncbi:MAG: hypothetical protein PHF06_13130 [Sphaerochaeta sp.]|uniref:hypothetical protein n=1 Tax=Sphaerochaeta sp. TaxID=1972642 RepID=UPI002587A9CB|nr:hypothetical protein [Sphaerochaeta sp.]MDD4039318.1 hypothetical protein [Sphaerochaeta sp.]